jgi:hypothetical protein
MPSPEKPARGRDLESRVRVPSPGCAAQVYHPPTGSATTTRVRVADSLCANRRWIRITPPGPPSASRQGKKRQRRFNCRWHFISSGRDRSPSSHRGMDTRDDRLEFPAVCPDCDPSTIRQHAAGRRRRTTPCYANRDMLYGIDRRSPGISMMSSQKWAATLTPSRSRIAVAACGRTGDFARVEWQYFNSRVVGYYPLLAVQQVHPVWPWP